MGHFTAALSELSREHRPRGRRWVFVSYDRLDAGVRPWAALPARELGIILIESAHKANRRPYHRQKLGWVLGNQRRFALEQARRGVAVRYLRSSRSYLPQLEACVRELGPIDMVEASEREMRVELDPLVETGGLTIVEDTSWLTEPEDYLDALDAQGRARMDRFYRGVRRRTGILMEAGRPVGGKFSFDVENRRPWRGEPPAPAPPRFAPDAIEDEVRDDIERWFPRHPGRLDLSAIPTRREHHEALWAWAKRSCLPNFGPYQDAMSRSSASLFHARISASLNLGRLDPARVVEEVEAMPLPLASREGFIRQVLGWREFVRHVHRHHEGFTREDPIQAQPTDGGWARATGEAWPGTPSPVRRWGAPNQLGATRPLPPAYWGERSGLACLDATVASVWEEGYGHHISRLMVLANIATTLGFDPRELTDWFWAAYADAFDWVVEPNVLGMGSFALGDRMTTKPYVSGGAYIGRMSDHCGSCRFDPRKNCPLTSAYWDFLRRHAMQMRENPRMARAIHALSRRAPEKKRDDQNVVLRLHEALETGQVYEPA